MLHQKNFILLQRCKAMKFFFTIAREFDAFFVYISIPMGYYESVLVSNQQITVTVTTCQEQNRFLSF